LFLRSELLRIGGFSDGLLSADLETVLRFAGEGKRFGFIPVPGVAIRIHEHEATASPRFMGSGRALQERVEIFERALVDVNLPLIRDREFGVANMLARLQAPATSPEGKERIAGVMPRLAAIERVLNGSLTSNRDKSAASIAVLAICNDEPQASIDLVTSLRTQVADNVQLIVTCSSSLAPLIQHYLEGTSYDIVRYAGSVPRTVAINDALRLVRADVVTYAFPGVTWEDSHAQNLLASFTDANVQVVVSDANVHMTARGARTCSLPKFTSLESARTGLGIGEPAPLAAIAHRASAVDRLGRVNEALTALAEVEFVTRLVANSGVHAANGGAVTLEQRVEDTTLLAAPNAYVQELQQLYAAYPPNDAMQQRRTAHLQSLVERLKQYGQNPISENLIQLIASTRGVYA
jgi:hypothetical protein